MKDALAPSLLALRCFEAAARLEHFSRAADELHLTHGAVSRAVRLLEDCPLFNAGHGAVFTSASTHELDAAIMDGATLRSGAIANVNRVRNPIFAARKVMENSKHVFFVGEGAEAFAAQEGVELVDPSYFSTDARRERCIKQPRLAINDGLRATLNC